MLKLKNVWNDEWLCFLVCISEFAFQFCLHITTTCPKIMNKLSWCNINWLVMVSVVSYQHKSLRSRQKSWLFIMLTNIRVYFFYCQDVLLCLLTRNDIWICVLYLSCALSQELILFYAIFVSINSVHTACICATRGSQLSRCYHPADTGEGTVRGSMASSPYLSWGHLHQQVLSHHI